MPDVVYTLALILNDAGSHLCWILSPTPFVVLASHCRRGESWARRRQPAINTGYRSNHTNAYRSSHNKNNKKRPIYKPCKHIIQVLCP